MTEGESVFVCMLVSGNKVHVYNVLEFLVKTKEIHPSKMACSLLSCGLHYCCSQTQRINCKQDCKQIYVLWPLYDMENLFPASLGLWYKTGSRVKIEKNFLPVLRVAKKKSKYHECIQYAVQFNER